MDLGFIGTGTIASAVVRGIAGDGHRITVSRRGESVSSALAEECPGVSVADNQAVVDASEVVFLGLLPEAAPEVLLDLTFREGQAVVSFIAGLSLDTLAEWVAPARASAIMLPFPGIAQGGSPVLALGDTALIDSIFGARNSVFALRDAAELDAYLCAQAVLSPAVAMVAKAAEWMETRGIDRLAGEAFLRALVGSSLMGADCRTMIEALNTPGGYNQRLRQHMDEAGIGEALAQGLDSLER
jgi:pyrroline-5-carboxylate reductase